VRQVAALGADKRQGPPTRVTKDHPFPIVVLAVGTAHGGPLLDSGESCGGTRTERTIFALPNPGCEIGGQYSRYCLLSSGNPQQTNEALLDAPGGCTRARSAAQAARSSTRGRWYACDAVLRRLAPDLQDMRGTSGSVKKSTPWCAHDTSPGSGTWPPSDQPDVGSAPWNSPLVS
jgi:hypothetical protein